MVSPHLKHLKLVKRALVHVIKDAWQTIHLVDLNGSSRRRVHRQHAIMTAHLCLVDIEFRDFEYKAEDVREEVLAQLVCWYRAVDHHNRFSGDLFRSINRFGGDDQIMLRETFDTLWKLMSGEERIQFLMRISAAEVGLPEDDSE